MAFLPFKMIPAENQSTTDTPIIPALNNVLDQEGDDLKKRHKAKRKKEKQREKRRLLRRELNKTIEKKMERKENKRKGKRSLEIATTFSQ